MAQHGRNEPDLSTSIRVTALLAGVVGATGIADWLTSMPDVGEVTGAMTLLSATALMLAAASWITLAVSRRLDAADNAFAGYLLKSFAALAVVVGALAVYTGFIARLLGIF